MSSEPYLISRIEDKSYALTLGLAHCVLPGGPTACDPIDGCFFIKLNERLMPVVDLRWFLSGSYEVLKISTRLIILKSKVEGFEFWGIQAPGLTEIETLRARPLSTSAPFIKAVSQSRRGLVFHVEASALLEKLVATLPPSGAKGPVT